MIYQFKYAGFMLLAFVAFPLAGQNGGRAYAGVPTSAEYNQLVSQNKAAYNALKAKVNNAPALSAAGLCGYPNQVVVGPRPLCSTAADLTKLLNQNQAAEQAMKSLMSSAVSVPTTAEYNALVAKNQAAYDAMKKDLANAAALSAAGKCGMPGQAVVGPTPACATAEGLANLLTKNQAAEQAMKQQMNVATPTQTPCAMPGQPVVGPTPPCSTTQTATTTPTPTPTPVVNVNNSAITDYKCAQPGQVVVGPTPACATTTPVKTSSAGGEVKTASSAPKWVTQ